MTNTKTVVSIAKEIYDNMEYKTRKNGDRYCCLKNDIQWQTDIIHESHLDRMPNDDIYDRINTILDVIYELEDDSTEDNIRESVYQIEPDCYTSDLTKWLHSDNRNIYYLDNGLELETRDGFQLLAYAQSAYIQQIGNALVSAIQKYINNE